MPKNRAGSFGPILCVLSLIVLDLIGNGTVLAQVVSPVEIKDPAMSTLQRQYMDDLSRAGEDILAIHFHARTPRHRHRRRMVRSLRHHGSETEELAR